MAIAEPDRIERLERLVERLGERVESLEGRLGGEVRSPDTPAPPPPARATPRPPGQPTPPAPLTRPEASKATRFAASMSGAGAAAPPAPGGRQDRPRRIDAATVERVLGGRVYAVLGALVVIAGVALFLKLAYDQGWLERITGAQRCIASAVFGGVLIVCGEFARRRWGALAGAGLTAAGLGAIYASAYAAHAVFSLVAAPSALTLLALTAALGVAIGVRARLASVSVVSLLGGYLAPLLLHEGVAAQGMGVYFLALLAAGLGVSLWRGERFAPARTVVWWGTLLLGGQWALGAGEALTLHTTAFLALAWGMIHAERIAHSLRHPEPLAPSGAVMTTELNTRAAMPLLASFTFTAWAATIGVLNLRDIEAPEWAVAAALGAAAAAVGMALGGPARVLRDFPSTAAQRLAAALVAQAGALAIATIALALGGWAEALAAAALGVAATLAGRWVRARALDLYGVAALLFATLRLFEAEWWVAPQGAAVSTALGFELSRMNALAAGIGAAWLVASRLMLASDNPGWRGLRRAAAAVGVTIVFLSPMSEGSSPVSCLMALTTMTLALALMGRSMGSPGVAGYAVAALLVALTAHVMQVARLERPEYGVAEWRGLAVSWWTLAAAWVGVAGVAVGLVVRRPLPRDQAPAVLTTIGLSLVALFAAALVERSDPRAVTVAWLALAFGVRLMHRAAAWAWFERFAVFGALASAAMWFAAYVEPGWFASDAPLAQHPGLWPLGAIVLVMLLMARNWPRGQAGGVSRAFVVTLLAGAGLMALTGTSLEVARIAERLTDDTTARRAAVSIWWGLFGAGALVAGFLGRWPGLRRSGLALIGVATVKAVAFDLQDVPPGWRVASLIALGLLMLAVAVVYTRASGRARAA